MNRITWLIAITCFAWGSTVAADISSRVEMNVLTLSHTLEASSVNWCTWVGCSLGPRLYQAVGKDGSILVGWTDSSGDGHVSWLTGGTIQVTRNFSGSAIKGLVAHKSGEFAVMLWQSATDSLRLSKRAANGSEIWSAILNNTDPDTIFTNNIGDSRLAFHNDTYAAYFSVDCLSGVCEGHSGDQFKWVSNTGEVTSRWDWGCTHSMATLVGYHPGFDTFTGVCSSDCYPQKGLNADRTNSIFVSDANCAGGVALQLGQMAAGNSRWNVVFSAQAAVCCNAHGIGLASFNASYQTSIVWLTNTDGTTERDPVLARLRDGAGGERYLVGWRTEGETDFHLGIINGEGAFLEGPESVGAEGIVWGARDDSFLSHADGSVTWFQGDASSSTLRFFRFAENPNIFSDGFEDILANADLGPVQCSADLACPGISLCIESAPGGICSGCGTEADCPVGTSCEFGACIRDCTDSTDCSMGMHCLLSGQCAIRSCETGTPCPEPYECSEGLCRRPACDAGQACPNGMTCSGSYCVEV